MDPPYTLLTSSSAFSVAVSQTPLPALCPLGCAFLCPRATRAGAVPIPALQRPNALVTKHQLCALNPSPSFHMKPLFNFALRSACSCSASESSRGVCVLHTRTPVLAELPGPDSGLLRGLPPLEDPSKWCSGGHLWVSLTPRELNSLCYQL